MCHLVCIMWQQATLREANSTACLSNAGMPSSRVANICWSCVCEYGPKEILCKPSRLPIRGSIRSGKSIVLAIPVAHTGGREGVYEGLYPQNHLLNLQTNNANNWTKHAYSWYAIHQVKTKTTAPPSAVTLGVNSSNFDRALGRNNTYYNKAWICSAGPVEQVVQHLKSSNPLLSSWIAGKS